MAHEHQLPLGVGAVGRQLARSAVHADGRVLLQRDSVLTAASVQQLQRHGVAQVWVVALDAEPISPVVSRSPAQIGARLAHLFRHHGPDADDRYLHELLIRYRGGEIP